MNCPTRDTNPDIDGLLGYNQSPPQFAPELTTRSSLVCGGKAKGEYNLSLHVIALFIVLFQSILSCSFPLMVKRFPFLKVPHQFLFLSKHFGTGVLIATAFVHLLPTAFTSLTDPCLPKFWNEGYPAMAGLIAMTAVFFVVVIEMIFSTMNGSPTGGCHSGDLSSLTDDSAPTPQTRPLHRRGNSTASIISLVGRNGGAHGGGRRNLKHSRSNSQSLSHLTRGGSFETERLLNHNSSSPHPSDPSTSTAIDSDSDSDSESLSGTELKPITRRRRSSTTSSTSTALHAPRLSSAQRAQKSLLQVLLLEAGILFHSIFIGMALSVATGPTFIVLLIAIVFHQTFEGLALGSRIAALSVFKEGDPKPWLMCLAYGTTTPIGQAVGLVARDWYEPGSEGGLVVVGVMNAISSGLLVFAGLVELLAEDFLTDESYLTLRGKKRVQACVAVGAGAAGMALVGAWA